MVTAILLAARGIKTLVLERNRDFEREFRGEILMPRFTQIMRQIGLFDFLMQYPHEKIEDAGLFYHEKQLVSFQFSDISKDAPFALWMSQTLLLTALADYSESLDSFELWFESKVVDVTHDESGKVSGVLCRRSQDKGADEDELFNIEAKVVVGADGRYSNLRKFAGFEMSYDYHQVDVVWFHIPRPPEHKGLAGMVSKKHIFLFFSKYPDLIQVGLVLPAGEYQRLRRRGIDRLREEIRAAHPMLHDFADNLKEFKQFTMLKGIMSQVKDWAQDGCVLIGDAAHTCSPAGGIGVSIAVGTAVVAADVLGQAFEADDFSHENLSRIQQLRAPVVDLIHTFQGRAGRLFPYASRVLKWIAPWFLPIVNKLGIAKYPARRLLVESEKLMLSSPSPLLSKED